LHCTAGCTVREVVLVLQGRIKKEAVEVASVEEGALTI
jgi:hypothetical protein